MGDRGDPTELIDLCSGNDEQLREEEFNSEVERESLYTGLVHHFGERRVVKTKKEVRQLVLGGFVSSKTFTSAYEASAWVSCGPQIVLKSPPTADPPPDYYGPASDDNDEVLLTPTESYSNHGSYEDSSQSDDMHRKKFRVAWY